MKKLLLVGLASFFLGMGFAFYHAFMAEPAFWFVPVPVDPDPGYEAGYQDGVARFEDVDEMDRQAIAVVLSRYPAVEDPELWAGYFLDAGREFKVPVFILVGQALQESSGNRLAVSSAGCVGLMQVNWGFWGDMLSAEGIAHSREDLFDPQTAIRAGARILRQLLVRYDGDLGEALRHYSGSARMYERKVFARATGWK